jgi:UDP-N-acetylmuramyl pentapeptide synthase
MDSTDDNQTVNNVVRHEYRVLTDVEKQHIKDLKDRGLAFIGACEAIGKSREMSLAVTNAEQAVMWAVKHVTK